MKNKIENMKLDRDSKIPLYKQLYFELKNLIVTKKISDGDTFYSESDLIESFEISRITVRSALQLLENEGYLVRSQGNSSIVVDKSKFMWDLNDLTDDLRTFDEKLVTKLISVSIEKPNKSVAEELRLCEEDGFVYRIERVREVDDKKLARTIAYQPYNHTIDIPTFLADPKKSTTNLLRRNGENPTYVEEVLEAQNADEVTSSILELPENFAIFYRIRTTYDEKDKPLEYSESYYNPKYNKYYSTNQLKK
ncbi:GntR family transcriptional regulator [Enterococcus avium]|uniref:GntR family transcriptional regulator n=1 Tax=Enterococcus avium TaxID=33945 RepID=UPI0028900A7B|nr:GntR family transcriptional regulator [Enterococcus avium]MDT2485072.1 GntR family transcriptional regulator [Enterococcus avium]MDT2511430.1 GntR family transcriptional regulator [Enterococcus avium]